MSTSAPLARERALANTTSIDDSTIGLRTNARMTTEAQPNNTELYRRYCEQAERRDGASDRARHHDRSGEAVGSTVCEDGRHRRRGTIRRLRSDWTAPVTYRKRQRPTAARLRQSLGLQIDSLCTPRLAQLSEPLARWERGDVETIGFRFLRTFVSNGKLSGLGARDAARDRPPLAW
jgi:hypothetical protein